MCSDWNDCKLGDLLRVKHGFAFKGEHFESAGRYILLTPGNFYEVGGFKYTPDKEKFYTGTFPKEYICTKDDLIVAMTEQAEGLLGSTALVPCDDLFLHNQRIGLISYNSKKADKHFLYYLFRLKSVRKQLRGSASGTKVKHTSPDRIYDVKVRVPSSVTTQSKIAAVLSSLDAKIDLNNRINAELEAMAKTLYDYWFVQFDFPDKNGKPYKSSGGKMVWNKELKREIPTGWESGPLSDIANITMGQSPPGESYNETGDGMIFFQGCTDFSKRFPSVRQFTTQPTRFAKVGDILLSVRAPVGTMNIANADCCIGRGLAALNSKNGSISYLYGVMSDFKQVFDRRNTDGTTFGAITKDDLFSLKVIKPGSAILEKFQSVLFPAFDQQNVIEKANQHLSSLRDWLLPMLMNGQVRVS